MTTKTKLVQASVSGHCYYWLSLFLFLLSLYVFCFWPTLGKLPKLKFCSTPFLGTTRRNIKYAEQQLASSFAEEGSKAGAGVAWWGRSSLWMWTLYCWSSSFSSLVVTDLLCAASLAAMLGPLPIGDLTTPTWVACVVGMIISPSTEMIPVAVDLGQV